MEDIKLIPIDKAIKNVEASTKTCDYAYLNTIEQQLVDLIKAKVKGYEYVDESYYPVRVN